jgi:hypothetical protein
MSHKSFSHDSETMEEGSNNTSPKPVNFVRKASKSISTERSWKCFWMHVSRYQGLETLTMSGMATSINDEPGHEVLLLTNVQVHNKRYSEYHIPVSTIKRLESIA